MSKPLIDEEDVLYNKVLLKSLLEEVDSWAKEMEDYGIDNFAETMNVKGLLYRPSYIIRTSSRFESRGLTERTLPYKGEKIGERKYYSLNDVDAWGLDVGKVDSFEEWSKTFNITGSEWVEECVTCRGKGKTACSTCDGKGKESCSSCSGTGKKHCPSCSGKGKTSCSSCSGRGYRVKQEIQTYYDTMDQANRQKMTDVKVHCSSCGGSGRKKCSHCGGSGKVNCSVCGGVGTQTCRRCGGSGITTCSSCKGSGKQLRLIQLHQGSHVTNQKVKGIQYQIFNDFPDFNFNTDLIMGSLVREFNGDKLPDDLLEDSHIDALYRDHITDTLEVPATIPGGHEYLMRGQWAGIYQLECYDLAYQYEGQDYRLLLYFNDEGKSFIYAPESPFAELRDSYLELAEESLAKGKLDDAYGNYLCALDLEGDEKSEKLLDIEEQLEKRYTWSYRLNNWFAMLLLGGGCAAVNLLLKPSYFYFFGFARNLALKEGAIIPALSYLLIFTFTLYLLLFHRKAASLLKEYGIGMTVAAPVRTLFTVSLSLLGGGLAYGGLLLLNAIGLMPIVGKIVDIFV